MNEAQIFELLGRKQADLDRITGDYAKVVAVMRGLKDGSIDPERLTVNDDGTWTLTAEAKA